MLISTISFPCPHGCTTECILYACVSVYITAQARAFAEGSGSKSGKKAREPSAEELEHQRGNQIAIGAAAAAVLAWGLYAWGKSRASDPYAKYA